MTYRPHKRIFSQLYCPWTFCNVSVGNVSRGETLGQFFTDWQAQKGRRIRKFEGWRTLNKHLNNVFILDHGDSCRIAGRRFVCVNLARKEYELERIDCFILMIEKARWVRHFEVLSRFLQWIRHYCRVPRHYWKVTSRNSNLVWWGYLLPHVSLFFWFWVDAMYGQYGQKWYRRSSHSSPWSLWIEL